MHGQPIQAILDHDALTPEIRTAVQQIHAELHAARRLHAVQQQRIRRLDAELRAASLLQRRLRRDVPSVRGAYVRTLYEPADGPSGDICDVTRADESRIWIALADVTGHGLPSAILAADLRRLLRGDRVGGSAGGVLSASRALDRANRELLDSPLEDCEFVTAVVAVYDEEARLLRWARAGAPYPIVVRRRCGAGRKDSATCRAELVRSEGPLLGVIPGAEFETVELRLEPGDTVILHTDGFEAHVRDGPASYCLRFLNNGRCGTHAVDHLFETLGADLSANGEGPCRGSDEDLRGDDVSIVALHVTERGPVAAMSIGAKG